jgi:Ca2+/Na+ antiporter
MATIGAMALVGDRERERASALLRRHYLEGRLTHDELEERLGVALDARDHSDLRVALRRLPAARSTALVVRDALEPTLSAAHRLAVTALKAIVWLAFSVVLLVVFAGWLLEHGPRLDGLLGFPAAWLALSWLLWRARLHGRRPAPPRR